MYGKSLNPGNIFLKFEYNFCEFPLFQKVVFCCGAGRALLRVNWPRFRLHSVKLGDSHYVVKSAQQQNTGMINSHGTITSSGDGAELSTSGPNYEGNAVVTRKQPTIWSEADTTANCECHATTRGADETIFFVA